MNSLVLQAASTTTDSDRQIAERNAEMALMFQMYAGTHSSQPTMNDDHACIRSNYKYKSFKRLNNAIR